MGNRGGHRTAQKAATRAKVLEAAKLLFEAGGYETATIRSIAKVAGRSTGAVFSNFTGKEAIYREIYGHAVVSPEVGAGLLNVVRRALASGETLYGVDVEMAKGLLAKIDEAA